MAIDLKNLTIEKAHQAFKSGEFSVRELVDAYLATIAEKNSRLNAYLEIFDDIDQQVICAEKMFTDGTATLMTGIPIAVKDNIVIRGHIASAASKMLEHYQSPYDATVIAKLREQGAVFMGRTNMDEFAMGSSTEKSAFGPTRNPHDESRVPGGTSGGSAAAVAGDMALVALGSDTGGSVRQPASFCGLVGLKPTYGAVSRYGLIAAVSSFDQIGPLTKTVTDAEKLFSLMKGQDILDATTIPEALYSKKDLKGNKPVIGVPFDFLKEGIDEAVLDNFNQSIEKLKSLGYEIKEVTLPHNAYCLPGYYILNFAEISSNLSRLDGIRYGHSAAGTDLMEVYMKSRGEGFGREVRRRILLGTYVLSHGYYDAYYNRANALREIIRQDFKNAYEQVDVILTPTTPTPAWKIGEKSADPISMYLEDVFTVTANFTGMPALSIPSGFSDADGQSLPLGIQFTAPYGQEDILFSVGKDFLGEV